MIILNIQLATASPLRVPCPASPQDRVPSSNPFLISWKEDVLATLTPLQDSDSLYLGKETEFRPIVHRAAVGFDLPERFLACIIRIETDWNPNLNSRGLSQLESANEKRVRRWLTAPLDENDPEQSVKLDLRNRWIKHFWNPPISTAWIEKERPSRTPALDPSLPPGAKDPGYAIGLTAYWARYYQSRLFPSASRLTAQQLEILALAYNTGDGAVKKYCGIGATPAVCAEALDARPDTSQKTAKSYLRKLRKCGGTH